MNEVAGILHADVDAFFASVEQRDNPRLRNRPVIVGGGVVMAASYEAKRCGVRSAMNGRQARRLCPDAIVVEPRMDAYVQASADVFAVFHDTTPLVEGISIDEAFLDVRGLRRLGGTPVDIGHNLRRNVRERVGLAITVGIATTKHLAKVASDAGKPDGLLHVPAGEELGFLHPLPVEALWGVGPATAHKLRSRGIWTVGEIAAMTEASLCAIVGPAGGRHLHALAQNRDPRHVRVGVRRRSIGAQRSLGSRPRPHAEIDASLLGLVDRVATRMRDARRVGRTVEVRFRFGDFTSVTRSHTLPLATGHTPTMLQTARSLHTAMRDTIHQRGLTMIGVAMSNLQDADAVQLALRFDGAADHALDTALDNIRHKFGATALTRAVQLGRDQGMTMPTLPV